jgi:hypothetical protein
MLNGRNLVVDTFSLVYRDLRPWITHEFWTLENHDIVANSVYVIGRKLFVEYRPMIEMLLTRPDVTVVFDNAFEGSRTLMDQLRSMNLESHARGGNLRIIGGGDMDPAYAYTRIDHFLVHILDYQENIQAQQRTDEIFAGNPKPYTFMFLNGRARPHRKYLWERFRESQILDQSLWTMLESRPCIDRELKLMRGDVNVMATPTPLRRLPALYEYRDYRDTEIMVDMPDRAFIKQDMFQNTWGEIYLEPQGYVDTYFSLVTETVYDVPYSFRTEKIAKVIAMGHPWICAANQYFYRDMRDLGFQTFGSVIDESFDSIEDNQQRLDRIHDIVVDLVGQDLQSFLQACEPICKYNQQRLREFQKEHRAQIPQQFFSLINHGRP